MRVDIRTHFDFLDILRLLLLPGFGSLLLGLVFVLAKIQNLADWGVVVRGDFNQIQALLGRNFSGFLYIYDAVVFTFSIDKLYFGDCNFII